MPKYQPWGGGSQFVGNMVEFLKKRNHEIVFKLKKKIDLIFITANFHDIDPKIIKLKKKNPHTKILHRINECDKRKNTTDVDNRIFKINKLADFTVFISQWLADYFVEKGFNRSYKVIYNGCDPNSFFPVKEKRSEKPINLVTHHWSNAWMKGFDIYTKLDKIIGERKDLSFTYIGRYYQGYTPKNTKLISPLYGKDLGKELRNHDIYVTASRWEPCGMHHIEGARCGLPILFHSDGGGINESCRHYGEEYHDIESFFYALDKIIASYEEYRNKIRYDFLNMNRANKEYYDTIMDIIN